MRINKEWTEFSNLNTNKKEIDENNDKLNKENE